MSCTSDSVISQDLGIKTYHCPLFLRLGNKHSYHTQLLTNKDHYQQASKLNMQFSVSFIIAPVILAGILAVAFPEPNVNIKAIVEVSKPHSPKHSEANVIYSLIKI